MHESRSIGELKAFFPAHTLVSFIAKGGMGSVYQAREVASGREVALKVLSTELAQNSEYLTRFQQEAALMRRLRHFNITQFYDAGVSEGLHYISMEYVNGGSLHYSAHGTALDPSTALEITLGVCRAIQHAHSVGIIHRDLKPDNIFLTEQGYVKVGDFGLSRPFSFDECSQVVFTTEGYSAPEITEAPDMVDERADIYSIGVILYEMLLGHLPEEDFIHATGYFPDLDPWYDVVIQRCIHTDPDLRYSSIKALLADLYLLKHPEARHSLLSSEELRVFQEVDLEVNVLADQAC